MGPGKNCRWLSGRCQRDQQLHIQRSWATGSLRGGTQRPVRTKHNLAGPCRPRILRTDTGHSRNSPENLILRRTEQYQRHILHHSGKCKCPLGAHHLRTRIQELFHHFVCKHREKPPQSLEKRRRRDLHRFRNTNRPLQYNPRNPYLGRIVAHHNPQNQNWTGLFT